eukprot:gene19105-22881_t
MQYSPFKFDDESSVRGAIKDVRNEETDTRWCLVGYQANNTTLTILGNGSGSVEEFVFVHLKPHVAAHALVRATDDSNSVKYILVNFIGNDVNRVFKARLGTYYTAIKDLFIPFDFDINASESSEISSEIIKKVVNSGASHE